MAAEHIIKSYDEELRRLNRTIVEMGGLAESQLAAAIDAVVQRDSELAARVVEGDAKVDGLERDLATATAKVEKFGHEVKGSAEASKGVEEVVKSLQRQALAMAAGLGFAGQALAAMGPYGLVAATALGVVAKAFEFGAEQAAKAGEWAIDLRNTSEAAQLTASQMEALQRAAGEVAAAVDGRDIGDRERARRHGPLRDQRVVDEHVDRRRQGGLFRPRVMLLGTDRGRKRFHGPPR